ncbi:MAG: hypothetical protein JNK90_18225 [Planctomycetaceae bacterium]|nr:hypothetical protein [Planctomycetaceae bacterium]
MPKLEYFLLCESISVDQETNRVSLFNVLEDLHITKPPSVGDSKPAFILNQFVAVAVFNREPSDLNREFEACLRYNLPDKSHKEHKLKFKMERNRQRIVMRFVGVPPVERDGLLTFEMLVDGNHAGTHTIQLFSESSLPLE